MAITTYSELVTALTTSWPHRADLGSTQAIEFIALAEAKFNRRLRTRFQELALSETAIDASYQISIPANVVAVKRLWRTDEPKTPLMPATLDAIIEAQGSLRYGYSTLALHYAWESDKWRFDGTGNVAGVLYRNIAGLSGSNTTNWLLTSHPDLYLYAGLAEAYIYMNDQARAQMYEAKRDLLIQELNRTDNRDSFSGPLMVRAR